MRLIQLWADDELLCQWWLAEDVSLILDPRYLDRMLGGRSVEGVYWVEVAA